MPGKQRCLSFAGDLLQTAKYHAHRQNAADALAQEGCPGNARHAHLKRCDKQDIHGDVAQRGYRQKHEGGLAVSQRGENTRRQIVEKHKGQAPDVDVQIQGRIREHFLRRVDEPQKAVAAEDPHQHQQQAHRTAGQHGGGHRGLHAAVFLRAKELRDQHGAADVAAKGKGNENQGDLIAVAHGGQGVLSDEFAGHPAVGNVVQLLEHNAAEERQAEFPQHGGRISDGQILIHAAPPFRGRRTALPYSRGRLPADTEQRATTLAVP